MTSHKALVVSKWSDESVKVTRRVSVHNMLIGRCATILTMRFCCARGS